MINYFYIFQRINGGMDCYKNKIIGFALIAVVISAMGCKVQNKMFTTEKDMIVDSIKKQIAHAEGNYSIQKNDYLNIKIFTNRGEKIIDPNLELAKGSFGGGGAKEESIKYLVRSDGKVNLPMVGDVYLENFTLNQADSILAVRYSRYYIGAFVITSMLNKRVFVLGPFPAGAKVIPLVNENINLIEVITLYGGIPDNGKTYNIRVIRGDLKNPNVYIIDLSTIEGVKKANLDVEPNDIIYIESYRRPFLEAFKEFIPIISLLISITSISMTVIVLTRGTK